ncbi:MAG: pseudouridine synthase, partial [Planctomycetaceae bacterium]
CEEYVRAGRVSVDGEVVHELGATVDPAEQEVRLDGELIRPEKKRYYLLNKPIGVVCTHRDPAGRTRAIDLVPQHGPRLFTVGRLDESSQGLLLVTNDGELANRLAHPRYRVERTYRVQVAGNVPRETLGRLREGLYFTEGKFRVEQAKRLRSQGKSTFLELVLLEGKNREIRRLLARVGHKVLRLERIGFGPLRLGKLPPGAHRPLTGKEIAELKDFVAHGPRKRPRHKPLAAKRRS